MTEQNAKEKTKFNYKKILLIVVLAAALVYFGGVYYFSSHFLLGTEALGVELGGKNVESAEKDIKGHWKSYVLTLEKREGQTEELPASKAGVVVELGDSVKKAQEAQNPFLWPVSAWMKMETTADMKLSYDEAMLKTAVKELACMDKANMVKPVNAKIELGQNGFSVVNEILGTTILEKELINAVHAALLEGKDALNLEEAGCYKNPAILAEDQLTKDAMTKVNQLRNVVVNYDFQYTKETVDHALIDQWITIDKKMNVGLDYEKVLDYIEELAKKYDTYATVRNFRNSYGKDIQILFGAYGWKISQTKEAKALMEVIEKGQSGDREPIYMYTAQCRKEGNIDWDDTYAEVSISGQHVWFYKDGKCVVSTDVVTGDVVRPNRKTPTGAYAVLYKLKDQVLVGADYASGVKYWMPFDTNVGFHDASWRKPGEFGGNTYKGNGSHGCVNMPEKEAAKLYQYIEAGCPVFVY